MTSKSPTEQKTPTSNTRQPTYADKAVHLANQMAEQLCQQIPELRGAVITFDWAGELNQVSPVGVWRDAEGQAALTSDTVTGAVSQTARMLNLQTTANFQFVEQLAAVVEQTRDQYVETRESQGEITEAEPKTSPTAAEPGDGAEQRGYPREETQEQGAKSS